MLIFAQPLKPHFQSFRFQNLPVIPHSQFSIFHYQLSIINYQLSIINLPVNDHSLKPYMAFQQDAITSIAGFAFTIQMQVKWRIRLPA